MDEPSSTQSNPSVVKIGLSYGSKKKAPSVFVESIEDARNRSSLVDKWMNDISNLHKKKPAPTVHYTKPQPDVESLLQVPSVGAASRSVHARALDPVGLSALRHPLPWGDGLSFFSDRSREVLKTCDGGWELIALPRVKGAVKFSGVRKGPFSHQFIDTQTPPPCFGWPVASSL